MPTPKPPKRGSKDLLDSALSLDSIEQLKAIADPVRQQLLEHFARQPMTTKQVADELGYRPTRLYHHVAKLERAGLIRLVETRPVRGTTEKYYSTVATTLKIDQHAFSDQSARLANEIASLQVVNSLLNNVRREVAEYLAEPDSPTPDCGNNELVFVQAEWEVDDARASVIRQKLASCIAECEEIAAAASGKDPDVRKHRLILGWYPRTS